MELKSPMWNAEIQMRATGRGQRYRVACHTENWTCNQTVYSLPRNGLKGHGLRGTIKSFNASELSHWTRQLLFCSIVVAATATATATATTCCVHIQICRTCNEFSK